MDNFKKMIGEMKQAEQKEEQPKREPVKTDPAPQPKIGAPEPKEEQPKMTASGKRIIPYKEWEKKVGGPKEVRKRAQKWVEMRNAKKQDEQPQQPLFDEYELATEEGRKASAEFLERNGIEDVLSLTNEQYNDLAKKAMDEFGIKDLSLAQEFIQSNEKSDRKFDERLARQKPQSDNARKRYIDKFTSDLLQTNPDKKTRYFDEDALYENVAEAFRGIGDEEVKSIVADLAKNLEANGFVNDSKRLNPGEPQPQQQNGFQYTEELGNYNDYYGAKTGSERNLNLYTSNDRDLYNYVSAYFPELIEKAETDPQGAVESMVRHASPAVRGEIDPKNVSPEYVRKLLAGFAEEMSEEQEPFTEKEEDYNDYYGAKTHSEREFNVETANDERMYNYILANKGRLLRNAKYYPSNVVNDIIRHGQYPSSFYGIDPKNIRKDYLIKVISGLGEE